MSADELYGWSDGALHPLGAGVEPSGQIRAVDSWLVVDGTVRALALHRDRFFDAVLFDASTGPAVSADDLAEFWEAAIGLLPRQGQWFPRVEYRTSANGVFLLLRVRPAPPVTRSVVVAAAPDGDPRIEPGTKGPDLQRLATSRADVASLGAEEAIILTPEGFVVEGAYSGLLWWRGNILCAPLDEFDRVDSVTVRSVLALATALGIESYREAVTPAELDGTELWALSALHGARIVTGWPNGPMLAELPGRLATWQARLGALRQPV
jgi:branched-subunit amino acid aminotransferase/4-amino-4-deoxychorismate lyase